MLRQPADERLPIREPLWRSHVRAVAEHGALAQRDRRRHEAELDERPNTHVDQRIVDDIDVVKGMEKGLFVANQGSHVVGEDSVEADMTEPQLLMGPSELLLPV